MGLADNIAQVQERIARACTRAGRSPSGVTLVAVTKTTLPPTIVEAVQLGLRDFGENRIQEAAEKIPNLKSRISNLESDLRPPPAELTWHLIGHLQSRKAREAVELFDLIHSVDSVHVADKLSRLCVETGRVMPVLLECNVSGEQSKYGFSVLNAADRSRWLGEVEAIVALPGVRVSGLMTVAPLVSEPEAARPFFRALRELRGELARRWPQADWAQLSMGMTDDFEVAVEEGATLVRIGRAIFGERPRVR
jgi:pyridoxal phosphate enzyme (YggS family)